MQKNAKQGIGSRKILSRGERTRDGPLPFPIGLTGKISIVLRGVFRLKQVLGIKGVGNAPSGGGKDSLQGRGLLFAQYVGFEGITHGFEAFLAFGDIGRVVVFPVGEAKGVRKMNRSVDPFRDGGIGLDEQPGI